ncbi:MAG: hypothetical protein N3I35_12770 [Clostridia bacterium]|nr:hypothetical protein [Clostridia bacterium]
MNIVLTLLAVVIFLVILLFITALRIIFTFNSDKENINLTLLWLYPFLKAVITNEGPKLMLSVYLLNRNIMKRELGVGKSKIRANKLELIRQVKTTDANVSVSYGFRDPFITGVACGAINIASQFINIDSVNQNPDFVADNDYIYVDATAKVNLGSALLNLYRTHKNSSGD